MAAPNPLSRLVKRADSVALACDALARRAMREIRGELANLSEELNLAGSSADREKVYAGIRRRMALLARRMNVLMEAQNAEAAKGAAKSAADMTGLDVRYSPSRAKAICELVTPAQGENVAAVFTDRMGRALINSLREATVGMLREQAVAGGSLKDMSRDLAARWSKAAKVDDPRFTDSSGRVWNTATYIQMNVRTNTMRVYNDCLADDVMQTTGSDLMRISAGGDPDCDCAAWEGCIISMTGRTKGFPTYDDAREGGCFHPNCTHTLEYVDEAADADEIKLQKEHPADPDAASDPDAQDERKYQIDQARYMRDNPGMTQEEARVAVDRDNLEAAIRSGLVRGDAKEIVARMTDAQVTALCPDGNPPAFEPVKRIPGGTRAEPKYEPEKWNHGSAGGVVHVARGADTEHILAVCKVDDAGNSSILSPNAKDLNAADGIRLAKAYHSSVEHITDKRDDEALSAELAKAGEKIRSEQVEHMVVLNPDGSPRFDEFVSTSEGGVIPDQWKGKLKGATLTHNHPGLGGGLSHTDVFSARREGLRTIQATTPSADYTLTVDKWPSKERLIKAYEIANSEVSAKLGKSELSITERMQVVQDHVIARLAQILNFSYNTTHR